MSILKMLSGGGMPPFTYYQPVAVNNLLPQLVASNTVSSYSSGATEKGKITDKDLMEMLGKIDGLPSDMNKVYDMMSTFYRELEYGLSTSSLSNTYLRALQYLKTAKFNKEQFDNAYKTVSKNDGLNEIAINESGHIIVQDLEGNIKYLTADDYLNNRDKYRAFTNLDLLQIRAQSPEYAYKNDLFNTVNNGIGLGAVDKLIQLYMILLGENSTTNGGYVQKKEGQILKGIEVLLSAISLSKRSGQNEQMSLDGLYKTKILTKELAEQASNALHYIYQMLPDNAKTLLKVKTGSTKGAIDLLTSFVSGQTSNTYEFEPDMLEDATGHKPGSKTKDATEDKTKNDIYLNIIRGEGGTDTIFNIMNDDGEIYLIDAIAYPNFTSKSIDTLGSLSDLLSDTQLQGITKGNGYGITFGNKVLDANDMNNIVYLNDQKAVRTILPVTTDPITLQIVPDHEFISLHRDLIKLINSKKGNMQDPEVRKKLLEEGIVNEFSGQLDMSKFLSYLCINGLATSRNITDTSSVTEIKGDALEQYIDMFENALYRKKGEGNQGNEYKFNFDTQDWYDITSWFGDYDHLYKGTIYIPLTENALQAGQAAGTDFTQSLADSLESTYLRGLIAKSINPTSSNLLGI